MYPQRDSAAATEQVSITPAEGWHCSHFFYRFDRHALTQLAPDQIRRGSVEFASALDPQSSQAPQRLQTSIVSGHKADFAVMLLDPDPLKIDAVHQSLLASPLGPAIDASWSFVSMTEVSEYVPTVEQYAERLKAEGTVEGSPAFEVKVKAYADREPTMRRQRLMPDLPDWPAMCFYPMNKKRKTGENWFTLPFPERNRLMAEHARSGMAFAGKVSQLITVGIGLEDWEWGVTLWARNPQFLREIVYRMRFDEASARYAEFGPFYVGYLCSPQRILEHCRVAAGGRG